jgi:uroporphyrinogen-III synthase
VEAALRAVDSFDLIVFASRHAVAAVTEIVPSAPKGARIAAVGSATAQVLRQRGWPVDLLPSEASAAALVAAFEEAGVAGEIGGSGSPQLLQGIRVLFPASSRALPTISVGLNQLGAEVVQVEAYRTESSAALDVESCRSWIARGGVGAVTFASPSAVDELEHALGKEDFDRLLSAAAAVAIGPTTARALSDRGFTPTLAESATLHGLAHTTHRILMEKLSHG